MISKILLIGTMLLGFVLPSFGIKYYSKGDTLIVISNNGLNLRKSADKSSDILITIPKGDSVIILEDKYIWERLYNQNDKERFPEKVGKDYRGIESEILYLKGRRAKVNYKGNIGYVADCYLSKYRPIYEDERLMDYFDSVYIKTDIVIEYESEHCTVKKYFYSNGLLVNIVDDCGEGYGGADTYIFPLSFEEAYHIFVNLFKQTGFRGINQGIYHFNRELGDIYIEERNNYVEIVNGWGN